MNNLQDTLNRIETSFDPYFSWSDLLGWFISMFFYE